MDGSKNKIMGRPLKPFESDKEKAREKARKYYQRNKERIKNNNKIKKNRTQYQPRNSSKYQANIKCKRLVVKDCFHPSDLMYLNPEKLATTVNRILIGTNSIQSVKEVG